LLWIVLRYGVHVKNHTQVPVIIMFSLLYIVIFCAVCVCSRPFDANYPLQSIQTNSRIS